MDIERRSFDWPWREEQLLATVRWKSNVGKVAEINDRVVGYMLYGLELRVVRLLNFAVDYDFRRQGIGTAMVRQLQGKLSANRRNRIRLKISESNLDGQLFFKSLGFVATGVEHGAYTQTDEDAIDMVYRLRQEAFA